MTRDTKLNLMWIPIEVLRFSLGLSNNYLKVPKVSESFPILSFPRDLDFRHFGTKTAKTIVSIAKLSEKLIAVLKLLALVCPKYIEFRLKEKLPSSKLFII